MRIRKSLLMTGVVFSALMLAGCGSGLLSVVRRARAVEA
jgi:outer membrane murein-binding lipoprotein Lpp